MQVNPATGALYIANPLSGRGMTGLFSTHPPIPVRIEKLRRLDARNDPLLIQTVAGARPGPTAGSSGTGPNLKGGDAGGALPRPRPRPLVVRGAFPERERTEHVHRLHPYPRQVHSPARRGAPRPLRARRRPCARSVRLARAPRPAGARVRLRRDRNRHRCIQRPADGGQDRGLRPRRPCSRTSSSHTTRPSGAARIPASASPYVRAWYAATAVEELLAFRDHVADAVYRDAVRIVLARAARSARRTTHFDLDLLAVRRTRGVLVPPASASCRPVESARRFPLRYALDTLERIEAFAAVALRTAPLSSCTAMRGCSRSPGVTTASSPRRRIPG